MSKGNQRCGNCRYFARYLESAPGMCRIRSPAVMASDVAVDGYMTRFPLVEADCWCGEWQAEEPTTNDETLLQLAREVLRGDLAAALALVDRLTVDTPG